MAAAFAACTQNRTFTMAWACRDQRLAMNSCMLRYQGQDEMDAARATWFLQAGERKRKKEELAEKEREARRKHAEWWNLREAEEREKERVADRKSVV